MKRFVTLAAATALSTTFPISVSADDLATQIVGVWKIQSNYNKELATGKMNYPLGEKPAGYVVYTKGGRLIFALVAGDRAKPAASATDAERVALYNTLASGSGSYKVEGDTLTVTYDTSWLQTWTGTTQKRKIAISGNRLTVTSEPTKLSDGKEVVFENVLERAE
jgi:Lipocalin-like domain